jgi:hypothetical protein
MRYVPGSSFSRGLIEVKQWFVLGDGRFSRKASAYSRRLQPRQSSEVDEVGSMSEL